jgi:hypothetical protein
LRLPDQVIALRSAAAFAMSEKSKTDDTFKSDILRLEKDPLAKEIIKFWRADDRFELVPMLWDGRKFRTIVDSPKVNFQNFFPRYDALN